MIVNSFQGENETRKTEIHGLKDILVRENECRATETDELRYSIVTQIIFAVCLCK